MTTHHTPIRNQPQRTWLAVLGFVLAGLGLQPAKARAQALPARETAEVRDRWQGQVGVFNPLRLGVAKGIELEAHPLTFLVAPHATVRVRHLQRGPWTLTGLYSAGVPTAGFRLAPPFGLAGFLTPSCKVRDHEAARGNDCWQPPWVVTLGVGAQASRQFALAGRDAVATATLQVDKGIAIGDQPARSLDAWAPVEAQFAPAMGLWRGRLALAWDQAVASRVRLRGEASLLVVERQPALGASPWLSSVYAGADVGLGQRLRLTAGAIWWNADQHAVQASKTADGFDRLERVRTHSVWPTLDLLWRW